MTSINPTRRVDHVFQVAFAVFAARLLWATPIQAQNRQAPPGMFKDLDDEILGDALLIHGNFL